MPDGFSVFIPSIDKSTTRIRVDELNGMSVSFLYEENKPLAYSKANCANAIHSVDALVLRNMIRRCSYDTEKVIRVNALLFAHLLKQKVEPLSHGGLTKYVNMANRFAWVDPVIIDHIDESNIDQVPLDLAVKLSNLLDKMLENPSFHLITVHDAFRCHAKYGNVVRYWYKEILAELSESKIIECILTDLTGKKYTFNKYDEGVADAIRNSNYGLC